MESQAFVSQTKERRDCEKEQTRYLLSFYEAKNLAQFC